MDELAKRAIEVLHGNDRGTWTRPSPRLYPHQWSWDAAFVAMGWAQLDPLRGIAELWSLLKAQWSTGMVPQIRFDLNVGVGAYEPGPNAWGTALHAPPGTATSGICQPPVHAIALARIREFFAPAYADGANWWAMDVEFKFDAEPDQCPQLYVKQARPFGNSTP